MDDDIGKTLNQASTSMPGSVDIEPEPTTNPTGTSADMQSFQTLLSFYPASSETLVALYTSLISTVASLRATNTVLSEKLQLYNLLASDVATSTESGNNSQILAETVLQRLSLQKEENDRLYDQLRQTQVERRALLEEVNLGRQALEQEHLTSSQQADEVNRLSVSLSQCEAALRKAHESSDRGEGSSRGDHTSRRHSRTSSRHTSGSRDKQERHSRSDVKQHEADPANDESKAAQQPPASTSTRGDSDERSQNRQARKERVNGRSRSRERDNHRASGAEAFSDRHGKRSSNRDGEEGGDPSGEHVHPRKRQSDDTESHVSKRSMDGSDRSKRRNTSRSRSPRRRHDRKEDDLKPSNQGERQRRNRSRSPARLRELRSPDDDQPPTVKASTEITKSASSRIPSQEKPSARRESNPDMLNRLGFPLAARSGKSGFSILGRANNQSERKA